MKNLHSDLEKGKLQNNLWNEHSAHCISTFVEKELASATFDQLMLNVGKDNADYNVSCKTTHSSVENLSFPAETFDYSVCVGDVMNYSAAISVISDISSVLKSGGKLIIGFERTQSGQFIFTQHYNKAACPQKYKYNRHGYMSWAYSEFYVRKLLSLYHLKVVKIKRFHVISSFAQRYDRPCEDKTLSALIKADKYCRPISKLFAYSVVFCCVKEQSIEAL